MTAKVCEIGWLLFKGSVLGYAPTGGEELRERREGGEVDPVRGGSHIWLSCQLTILVGLVTARHIKLLREGRAHGLLLGMLNVQSC